jgi:hypothetical protein
MQQRGTCPGVAVQRLAALHISSLAIRVVYKC